MKPTILKVYSNFPDDITDIKKDKKHLIKISNFENKNPQLKFELIPNNFNDNDVDNENGINESSRDVSVLEDYYRFQQRRNASLDLKKSICQNSQFQQKCIYERPNYSYTQLIYMAIESSATKALTVHDIYTWCELNFSYYANAMNGWKNSLRHNLSINKCFKKITKMGQGGRGSLWIIDPRERQHLVSTMHRSNVSSLTTAPFIIQPTTAQSIEPPRVTIVDNFLLEIPSQNAMVVSDNCRLQSGIENDSLLLLENKPSYCWTDTRLPCDASVPLTPDNYSDTSDTDFNDWKRVMVSMEPVFPVKHHQLQSRNGYQYPVITPPTSLEHNYSITDLKKTFDNPSSVARHVFQPAIDFSFCASSDCNDEDWPRTPSPALWCSPLKSKVVMRSDLKRSRSRNVASKPKRSCGVLKPPRKIGSNEKMNNVKIFMKKFINSV